ncbi:HisJ ABC-type amino acid transport/signal transduction systems, periplasmic component/domain [Rhabdaerophilaceae bacterium]
MRSAFIAFVTMLALWSGDVMAQQKSRLAKVLESGVIRVGTTGDFFPMSFKDPGSNTYKGHQIDAAEKFAADSGLKVEYVLTEWRTLINGLVADKYDIVMTGTSMSMGRAKTATFSDVWGVTGFMPLVQKKNAARFKTWDDLNKPDVTIGVNLGTTFVPFIQSQLPNAKLRQVDSPARDWQELLAGRVDVTITSILEGAGLTQRHQDLQLLFSDQIRNTLPMAFLVPSDDQQWINYVNAWVAMSKANGFFKEINTKWAIPGQ